MNLVQYLAAVRDFSLFRRAQNNSGSHLTFQSLGTRGPFSGVKGTWELSILSFNGYRGLFPLWKGGRDVKLTAHPHLGQRLRMREGTQTLPHMPSFLGNF
jgi:hypothetical protein